MRKFRVTVDRAESYLLDAANSFDAWEAAFSRHPEAGRVEVKPASKPGTLRHYQEQLEAAVRSAVEWRAEILRQFPNAVIVQDEVIIPTSGGDITPEQLLAVSAGVPWSFNKPRRVRCPWRDYAGNVIHEGDVIQHPNQVERGVVLYWGHEKEVTDRWRVRYEGAPPDVVSRLCLQIGDKGQAVVCAASPINNVKD
jgi:hypothetical protein